MSSEVERTDDASPDLRLPGRPREPTGPHDTVARLVGSRLAEQVRELLLGDPRVRAELPESVHEMRIATRRLRSALATCRPFLDRTVGDPLRDELAWLSDALGAARDTQVQQQRLVQAFASLVEERIELDWEPDVVRPALLEPLARDHDGATSALHETLASARYVALIDRLRLLLADPPWTQQADKPIHTLYRRRVDHEARRLRQRMAVAGESLGPAERDEALHHARKAVKRLRYALEPLRPIYGERVKKSVKRLNTLQSALGQHHDTVVTRHYLDGLAKDLQRPLDAAAALAAGALVERESRQADIFDAAAEKAWEKVAHSPSLG